MPLVSVQHQYIVTEPIPGVTPGLPTLRDPDRLTYYKEEVGGLVMGGYEPNPKPWAERGLPERFEFQLLDDDWDHFEPIMELALGRVPALGTAGVKQLINGPESFTPDGNWIIGEAPETRGIFVGAGFNAFGIASAGGAGMALAEWVAKGEPPFDVWPVDIRRFGRSHQDTDWVRTRTLEAYGKHYAMAWPFEEHDAGRPLRRSPLYRQSAGAGRLLRREAGLGAAELVRRPRRGAGRPLQLRPAELVRGGRPRARRPAASGWRCSTRPRSRSSCWSAGTPSAALSWLCANDVAKPPGSLTYTQLLNDRGGIECDLTVARLAHDRFYLVTGTGFATHDFDWIARHIPAGLDAASGRRHQRRMPCCRCSGRGRARCWAP